VDVAAVDLDRVVFGTYAPAFLDLLVTGRSHP
jgi:hypothetical protein